MKGLHNNKSRKKADIWEIKVKSQFENDGPERPGILSIIELAEEEKVKTITCTVQKNK